jgi:hypothetical protein
LKVGPDILFNISATPSSLASHCQIEGRLEGGAAERVVDVSRTFLQGFDIAVEAHWTLNDGGASGASNECCIVVRGRVSSLLATQVHCI